MDWARVTEDLPQFYRQNLRKGIQVLVILSKKYYSERVIFFRNFKIIFTTTKLKFPTSSRDIGPSNYFIFSGTILH